MILSLKDNNFILEKCQTYGKVVRILQWAPVWSPLDHENVEGFHVASASSCPMETPCCCLWRWSLEAGVGLARGRQSAVHVCRVAPGLCYPVLLPGCCLFKCSWPLTINAPQVPAGFSCRNIPRAWAELVVTTSMWVSAPGPLSQMGRQRAN